MATSKSPKKTIKKEKQSDEKFDDIFSGNGFSFCGTPATVNLKKRFLICFLNCYGHINQTCKETGVWRSRYYRWLKGDKDFQKACDSILDLTIDGSLVPNAIAGLHKKVKDNDMKAISFALNYSKKGKQFFPEGDVIDVQHKREVYTELFGKIENGNSNKKQKSNPKK